MLRFFALCLILAVGCVAGILAIGHFAFQQPLPWPGIANPKPPGENPGNEIPGEEPTDPAETFTRQETPFDQSTPVKKATAQPVSIETVTDKTFATRPLIVQDARVLPMIRIEVPSERDGKLLVVGTLVEPGEFVPEALRMKPYEIGVLAVNAMPGEQVAEIDRIEDPDNPAARMRRPKSTDTFAPGTTKIVRKLFQFRRLSENEIVRDGQILGVVNPILAFEEVAIKQSKVEAAEADVVSTDSMLEESKRRLSSLNAMTAKVRGSASADDIGMARVTVDRYKAEKVAKRSAVIQAQRELSGSWATLDMHVIRAPISGQIRTIYKHTGETVKNLEAVLQLQSTSMMRVEAQIEVQDAIQLRARLKKALDLRAEARSLEQAGNLAASKKIREQADRMVAVEVEASLPQAPAAVLSGHLAEVTCVAVPRTPLPQIASGSEEGYVRIWSRQSGDRDQWKETYRLNHREPIRALGCTGKSAAKNLMVTATSTGWVRLFDLDDLKAGSETVLSERHSRAVRAVAFNSTGTLLATGGDDQSIRIWDTATGKMLLNKPNAHRGAITTLAFTPDSKQLVSAGNDKQLLIWNLKVSEKDSRLDSPVSIPGHSNDVGVLGLDPTGKYVLVDEGRELRMVALADRAILGSLVNAGVSGSFTTMALFSPDGRTILTNGNGQGRLQLWRAPNQTTRAAELRQMMWTTGKITSGTFDPEGKFAVTGTEDHRVLVWKMPDKTEVEKLTGQLTFIEDFVDSSLKRVTVRATVKNPTGSILAGSSASIIVPPLAAE